MTVRAGTNTVLGLEPSRIGEVPGLLRRPQSPAAPPPLWDGRAAERVADVVTRFAERPEDVARPVALTAARLGTRRS